MLKQEDQLGLGFQVSLDNFTRAFVLNKTKFQMLAKSRPETARSEEPCRRVSPVFGPEFHLINEVWWAQKGSMGQPGGVQKDLCGKTVFGLFPVPAVFRSRSVLDAASSSCPHLLPSAKTPCPKEDDSTGLDTLSLGLSSTARISFIVTAS